MGAGWSRVAAGAHPVWEHGLGQKGVTAMKKGSREPGRCSSTMSYSRDFSLSIEGKVNLVCVHVVEG